MPGGSEAKRGMTLPRYNEVVRRVVPRPVVATARDALRRYGTTTASARPLPDYMVAGTKKGGTTSIINWLVDHPHVCRMWPSAQKLKSAHYYDINYGKGEDWYRSHFPTDRSRRGHEKKTGTYPLVGEASPYYMFHPAVPERVLETAPSMKVRSNQAANAPPSLFSCPTSFTRPSTRFSSSHLSKRVSAQLARNTEASIASST